MSTILTLLTLLPIVGFIFTFIYINGLQSEVENLINFNEKQTDINQAMVQLNEFQENELERINERIRKLGQNYPPTCKIL